MRVYNYLSQSISAHLLYFQPDLDAGKPMLEQLARQSQAVFNFLALVDPGMNRCFVPRSQFASFKNVRDTYAATMVKVYSSLARQSITGTQALDELLLKASPERAIEVLRLGAYDDSPIMGGGHLRIAVMDSIHCKRAVAEAAKNYHWELAHDDLRRSAA